MASGGAATAVSCLSWALSLTPPSRLVYHDVDHRGGIALQVRIVDFTIMGCLGTRVEVLERIGLIDPRYFIYCEDIDYSLRLIAAGYRIGFVPEAEGWYKGSASMVPGSARHDYHMVRSSLLPVQKFYPRLMPIAFAHSLARCAAPKVVRREGERLRAVLRADRDVPSWNERAA
jgi:GT2 family glycosyltransferase